jgi:hypothetical protein
LPPYSTAMTWRCWKKILNYSHALYWYQKSTYCLNLFYFFIQWIISVPKLDGSTQNVQVGSISEISFKFSFQKIHRIQKVSNQNSLSVKLQTFVCSFPIWALISINPNEILLPAA